VDRPFFLLHKNMLDVEFTQVSDLGRVRAQNEDYLGHAHAGPAGWLFVVADGVGGHDLGEVASRTAVESLLAGFLGAAASEAHTALLPRLVQAANLKVYETGRAASPGGVNMATTIVTCALRFDRVVVAHVGDSRCYLIRHDHATPLTRDHTVVADQVRLGILSAQEAAQASTRHVLSRSLGSDLFVNVDSNEHQLIAGDVLALCSDGLHGAMTASEIARLVTHGANLETSAQKLVALANDRDGSDNITVQLVRVRDVERIGMYRGRPYKLR
jgi:PPM family protein phosphatase